MNQNNRFYAKRYHLKPLSPIVTAKPWVVVAVMAMMCLMPYQSVDFGYLSDDAESKEGPGQGQGPAVALKHGRPPTRILLVSRKG